MNKAEKKTKELKLFLRASQYFSKHIETLVANIDILENTVETKGIEMDKQHKNYSIFKKKCITIIRCLAHYNADNENIITTDSTTKGLEATH